MLAKIKTLIETINSTINSMLVKMEKQAEEIKILREENKELNEIYKQTITKIEEYVKELEQIKHEHINNNNNAE
jgi:hypothetical protein